MNNGQQDIFIAKIGKIASNYEGTRVDFLTYPWLGKNIGILVTIDEIPHNVLVNEGRRQFFCRMIIKYSSYSRQAVADGLL